MSRRQNEERDWFREVTKLTPHPWQVRLLQAGPVPDNRLINIPTGLGKTLGVAAAWLYHRVVLESPGWPRRLVWCLPMRALVEQTAAEISTLVSPHGLRVHTLMGGADPGAWHLHPEENAVLVGTQDMLLSRALNRGYGVPRARWPMEFALLNSDCLWVLDEVQLMDVGLATSAQLQQFRNDEQADMPRPSWSWWMSATLQPDWLKSVDTTTMIASAEQDLLRVLPDERTGQLWDVRKPLSLVPAAGDRGMAALVSEKHRLQTGKQRLTLVVVNTVNRAIGLQALLSKDPELHCDLELVHSRFRPQERAQWRTRFLNRAACSQADRILIATQVVEAGVDISATCMITELAPWASLVQRFGRAGRYGGVAEVVVVDIDTADDRRRAKNAAPYSYVDMDAARCVLQGLQDVGPRALAAAEEGMPQETRDSLYRYDPLHLLVRRELDELFDTTPDLTGADIDISRFIRTGDERDVLVFWRELAERERPDSGISADHAELCPVPFLTARTWLADHRGSGWVWDYLDGTWRSCAAEDVWPGQTILVRAAVGGYSPRLGWTGNRQDKVIPVTPASPLTDVLADRAEQQEELAAGLWRTIATHGHEVGAEAGRIGRLLGLSDASISILEAAGRWHDVGKAHPAFQGAIRLEAPGHPQRNDLAKAPPDAWRRGRSIYRIDDFENRAGFRHELASAMAIFSLLRHAQPSHPALLGPHANLLAILGQAMPGASQPAVPAAAELQALGAHETDLLLYLVASHHGKVRMSWHAAPPDQGYVDRDGRGLPLRGIREGDVVPPISVLDPTGVALQLPELRMTLAPAGMGVSPETGISWTDRTERLRRKLGVFGLGYLEALLRVADIRASMSARPDTLLPAGRVPEEDGAR